ncbi:MAG: tRNA pseudouridine(38-40) synthase TruA [Propionibacteriaceae bacterium]|nr:tRNA pseudouridine(38-40) synthase TruA [Propionibacteriaceae bacterium]
MRWRLDLAYDGSEFSGWASQPGLRTVQGELETWIPRVLRWSSQPLPNLLTVAGRTDAGVHARGQVAHFDAPDDRDLSPELHRRLARVLPSDLVVHAVTVAPPGFDARFSALWRRYCYRLWDSRSRRDPLLRRHVAEVRGELDLAAFNEAGERLLGLRDFAPFCKRREGATTIRSLLELRAIRTADGTIEASVRADAFCHSMVRSLIGALVAVASGQRDLAWLTEVAAQPQRAGSVHVMAARGLTLEEVGYPTEDLLAARARDARATRTLPQETP